jgi:hypothetical protein
VSTLRVSSFIHSFNVIILNGSELFFIWLFIFILS